MSAIDRNKIFFGLIHYLLSEQKNVDWLLKTSYVNFTGINSTVTDQKYEKKSLSDDIIDYINQVKPYHTQFEQFIEKYSNKTDICNITTQDSADIEIEYRIDAVTSDVDEQGDMSDIDFMNTHAANRLWTIKHKDMDTDELKSYIEDVLNCHFKGITVDGNEFDIDKFGYDTFLYDENLYDAPTISADYYIIDKTEPLLYPYIKMFVNAGISTFSLKDCETVGTLKLYRNDIEEDFSYNADTKIVSIFAKMNKGDKILIINEADGIRNGLVYVATSFNESTDENSIREYVDLGTNVFKLPSNQYVSSKTIVNIEYPNGTRIPTYNFEKTDDGLLIKDELKENYHVIITVIDYGQLYDKIYTYEDCYGQSNNLITLDGNEFLRPYYEAKRPSELINIFPHNDLKIYTEENGSVKSLYNVDFKKSNTEVVISKTMTTKLAQDLVIGDKIIKVDNIKRLSLPYTNDIDVRIPGKILINSEIIEFYDYDLEENILKSIRRGSNGSYIAEKHNKDDTVYNYNEQTSKTYNYTVPSISTLCKGNNMEYPIPEEYVSDDKINVWKRENIQLLSDITTDCESFIISSNNILLPDSTKNRKGVIYINDDKIFFETIETVKKKGVITYKISDFENDKEYLMSNSCIYSATPTLLKSSEYTISNDKTKIILNTIPKDGEVIIVENEV